MKHFIASRYFKAFLITVYFSVVLVMCRYAEKNSYYDLDIVFYTACVIEKESASNSELQQRSYAMARQDLGEERLKLYTDSTKYFRDTLYKSADCFHSQLPFYKVKPMYVALLSVGYQLGISPFYFSTYLNLFCYASIALVLLFYLIKHLNFIRGYVVSFCLILFPTLLDASKNNTPDMLAAFFSFIAVLLFLSKRTRYWSILPLCLLVLTRPENMIFVATLCLVGSIMNIENYPRKFFALLFLCCVSCDAYITLMYSEYPWSILYRHSCLGFIPNPENVTPGLSIMEYLLGLRFLVNSVFYSEFFVIVLLLVYPLVSRSKVKNVLVITSYALLASFLVRILLFPDLSSRFFVGPLLISAVLFFRLMEPRPTTIEN